MEAGREKGPIKRPIRLLEERGSTSRSREGLGCDGH